MQIHNLTSKSMVGQLAFVDSMAKNSTKAVFKFTLISLGNLSKNSGIVKKNGLFQLFYA